MDNVLVSSFDIINGWQLYYDEDCNALLGSAWTAEAGANCNLPLSPLVINTAYSFNGQIGLGPFYQNTKINLDLFALGLNPNASVLWATGATTQCITVNPAVSTTYTVIVQDSTPCFDTVQVDVNPQ